MTCRGHSSSLETHSFIYLFLYFYLLSLLPSSLLVWLSLKSFVLVGLGLKVLKGFQDKRLVVNSFSCVQVGTKTSKSMVADMVPPQIHVIANSRQWHVQSRCFCAEAGRTNVFFGRLVKN